MREVRTPLLCLALATSCALACDSKGSESRAAGSAGVVGSAGLAGGIGRAGSGATAGGGSSTGGAGAYGIFDGSVGLNPGTADPLGLDCGPACRIALNGPINHAEWPPTHSAAYVVDSGRPAPDSYALYVAPIGASATQLFPNGVMPGLYGQSLSYLVDNYPKGDVVVYDMNSRTITPYFHYEDATAFWINGTMVSDKYVFWHWAGGIGKANLKTGEVGNLIPQQLECDALCFHNNDLVCGDTGNRIYLIDQDTGDTRLLDDGGAMQESSACSPDASKIAWVDYRDPPGTGSTPDGAHQGGEVYIHEFAAGQTTRLTHDSPNNPIPKAHPAIGDDIATWFEPCAICGRTFSSADDFFGVMTTLVRLDLMTGQLCRIPNSPYLSWSSLHGHHLYAYWLSTIGQKYLVDVDLDSPALNWQCDAAGADAG